MGLRYAYEIITDRDSAAPLLHARLVTTSTPTTGLDCSPRLLRAWPM